MNTRNVEKFIVPYAHTEGLKNSSKIYMQNILNEHEKGWINTKSSGFETQQEISVNGLKKKSRWWISIVVTSL